MQPAVAAGSVAKALGPLTQQYRLPVTAGANLSPVQHMLVLMIAVPLVLLLPGHLLLWLMFGR